MSYTERVGDRIWHSDDEMAIEDEVRSLIFGLVKATKPRVVVETGTYDGGTTCAIQAAMMGVLPDSELHTVDPSPRREQLGFAPFVTLHRMRGDEFLRQMMPVSVDMILLDSSADRCAEMDAALVAIRDGGYIIVHDSKRPNEAQAVVAAVKHFPKSQVITVDTPRGVAIIKIITY